MEAKEALIEVIKTLIEIKAAVPRQILIDVLMGKDTREVKDNNWDTLETYGIGEAHDEDYWANIIDVAYERGYLRTKSPKSSDLQPSATGKKFLSKPTSFVIDEESDMTEPTDDIVLDDIVKSTLQEHPAAEMTSSPKTKQQIKLIHAIDRKIALDDYAENESLALDDVLDEVENLIHQGRRLDITYFTDEVIGADGVQELTDFFRQQSDNLEAAMKEYGDVYNIEEIRLARIVYRVQQMK